MNRKQCKNYSNEAIEWLNYLSISNDIYIKHALNGGEVVIEDPELVTGTKKFKKYYVDGFCDKTNTIYEYFGDFVHGNPKISTNELFQRKYIGTMERINRLRELGFNVITMWHSDWLASEEREIYHKILKLL